MTFFQRTTIGAICVLLFAFALLFTLGFLYLWVQGDTPLAMFCFLAAGVLTLLMHRGIDLLVESYFNE